MSFGCNEAIDLCFNAELEPQLELQSILYPWSGGHLKMFLEATGLDSTSTAFSLFRIKIKQKINPQSALVLNYSCEKSEVVRHWAEELRV
jgi:hypothetical protein